MDDIVGRAVEALRRVASLDGTLVDLRPGLTTDEVVEVEGGLGFEFSDEHRSLLQQVLPVGERWPDWRHGPREHLSLSLAWPIHSALFDVKRGRFWPRSWGTRPDIASDALIIAQQHLSNVPRLVPIYGHRYLPAAPSDSPAPVFSVYQTDVIYYGDDLAHYIATEFKIPRAIKGTGPSLRVAFWSDLAEGADNEDL